MTRRIVIAGGGYIANEFAGIFNEFGAHVTIVNRGGDILRHYDDSIRDRLLQISIKKGIDFRFNAPLAVRRSALKCAPQPSASPMSSASVRM